MKKFYDRNILIGAIALEGVLSFLAATIPFLQQITNNSFLIGFPFTFFQIHVSTDYSFSTHLGIAGFVADIAVMYAICYLVKKYRKKK